MLDAIDRTLNVVEIARLDTGADPGPRDRADQEHVRTPARKPPVPDDPATAAVTGNRDEKLGTLLDVFV